MWGLLNAKMNIRFKTDQSASIAMVVSFLRIFIVSKKEFGMKGREHISY